MQFDQSFFDDATFVAGVETMTRGGLPVLSHAGDGEPVRVVVRPFRVTRVDDDGRILSATVYRVTFREDPSSLNGGLGVRLNDLIEFGGTQLIAQGPHYLPVTRADRFPLWRVDCVAKA